MANIRARLTLLVILAASVAVVGVAILIQDDSSSSEDAPGTATVDTQVALTSRAERVLSDNVVTIRSRRVDPSDDLVHVAEGTGTILGLRENGFLIITANHVVASDDIRAKRINGVAWCLAKEVVHVPLDDLSLIDCQFSEEGPLPDLVTPHLIVDPRGYVGRAVFFRCHFDEGYRLGRIVDIQQSELGASLLLTDAPAKRGCSGSGLIDSEGNLLAVVTVAVEPDDHAAAVLVPPHLAVSALQSIGSS